MFACTPSFTDNWTPLVTPPLPKVAVSVFFYHMAPLFYGYEEGLCGPKDPLGGDQMIVIVTSLRVTLPGALTKPGTQMKIAHSGQGQIWVSRNSARLAHNHGSPPEYFLLLCPLVNLYYALSQRNWQSGLFSQHVSVDNLCLKLRASV